MIGNLARRLAPTSHYDLEMAAYQRIASKGFRPATIIDVGAFEGNWSRMTRRVFPDAELLMVEPQPAKQAILQTVAAELSRARLVQAPLSDKAGQQVPFYVMETGSSLLPENSNVERSVLQVTTRTLDEVAEGLPGPMFLKIDVQGNEIAVLKGAAATLEKCELIQLEVALLPYNEGAPTFLETISFMDALGFVPLDISGFSRPNGVDLVQTDLLFCRSGSALRPSRFHF